MTREWRMFRASANMLRGAQWGEKTRPSGQRRTEERVRHLRGWVMSVMCCVYCDHCEPCSTCGHPQPRSHHHRWHDWWSQAGAPLSSQHRDDCKTILVGGVHTLRKARAHSTQPQTRFSIFCIMMFHWDAITSHHKRCWRLTRHLESFRVSLFSIDCHFLSYDRHWQGGVPGPSVWCSMHRSPIKYPFYSVSS